MEDKRKNTRKTSDKKKGTDKRSSRMSEMSSSSPEKKRPEDKSR